MIVYYNDVEFFREMSDATTGHAMLGYEDPFGSVGNPTDSLWGLFDNFRITANCEVGKRTWTGATNTDWHLATNWSPACVPTSNDDVVVPSLPAGATNTPTIFAPLKGFAKTISVESMTELYVQPGAQLEVDL